MHIGRQLKEHRYECGNAPEIRSFKLLLYALSDGRCLACKDDRRSLVRWFAARSSVRAILRPARAVANSGIVGLLVAVPRFLWLVARPRVPIYSLQQQHIWPKAVFGSDCSGTGESRRDKGVGFFAIIPELESLAGEVGVAPSDCAVRGLKVAADDPRNMLFVCPAHNEPHDSVANDLRTILLTLGAPRAATEMREWKRALTKAVDRVQNGEAPDKIVDELRISLQEFESTRDPDDATPWRMALDNWRERINLMRAWRSAQAGRLQLCGLASLSDKESRQLCRFRNELWRLTTCDWRPLRGLGSIGAQIRRTYPAFDHWLGAGPGVFAACFPEQLRRGSPARKEVAELNKSYSVGPWPLWLDGEPPVPWWQTVAIFLRLARFTEILGPNTGAVRLQEPQVDRLRQLIQLRHILKAERFVKADQFFGTKFFDPVSRAIKTDAEEVEKQGRQPQRFTINVVKQLYIANVADLDHHIRSSFMIENTIDCFIKWTRRDKQLMRFGSVKSFQKEWNQSFVDDLAHLWKLLWSFSGGVRRFRHCFSQLQSRKKTMHTPAGLIKSVARMYFYLVWSTGYLSYSFTRMGAAARSRRRTSQPGGFLMHMADERAQVNGRAMWTVWRIFNDPKRGVVPLIESILESESERAKAVDGPRA